MQVDAPGSDSTTLANDDWGKEIREAPETRSVFTEILSCGLFRCLILEKSALLESRKYLRATVEFGTILKWFYVADRTSLLPEGTKSYSRDTFFFIFLLLVVYCFSSWKKEFKAPVFLNRYQTEEWKGWMQVRPSLYLVHSA